MRLTSDPWPRPDLQGSKYYPCWLCGKTALTYELRFDAGAVEPVVGETLTGGSSTDTGVVVSVALEGGTWDDDIVTTITNDTLVTEAGATLEQESGFDILTEDVSTSVNYGNDAEGTIEFSGVTGAITDDQLTAFSDNETVSGSTGGSAMLTTNGRALRKLSGRLYPEGDLSYRDGHYYCREHYNFKYNIEDRADWARGDRIMEDND